MTNHAIHQPTSLGIDPGTRFMGFAALKDTALLDYGVQRFGMANVRTISSDRLARVLFESIRSHQPGIV